MKAYKEVKKLMDIFQKGDMPELVKRTYINVKNGMNIPSREWSFRNQIIMVLNGTADARGYRQWEKVGRKVKKGAKAFYIIAPIMKTVYEDKQKEDGTWEKIKKQIVIGFKDVPVFRYEDTEGEELPELEEVKPIQYPPLFEVAENMGINVKYTPALDNAYGWYNPGYNSITLCTHDVQVFFHELAHAVHNEIRPLKPGQDAEQEIVAETVAGTLALMYGYEGYEKNHFEYIKEYAGAKNEKEVIRAISRVLNDVCKVLDKIFEKANKAETEQVS